MTTVQQKTFFLHITHLQDNYVILVFDEAGQRRLRAIAGENANFINAGKMIVSLSKMLGVTDWSVFTTEIDPDTKNAILFGLQSCHICIDTTACI